MLSTCTGKLPLGGLSVRISDRPNMSVALCHGRKAIKQTNKDITKTCLAICIDFESLF